MLKQKTGGSHIFPLQKYRVLLLAAALIGIGAAIGTLLGLFLPVGILPALPPAKRLSTPRETGDPEKPYLLETAAPYTVAIDPGHGGYDNGTEGIIDEVLLCDGTSQKLYDLLLADPSFRPVLTRAVGEDPSNSQRAKVITENMASLVICIHGNSDGSRQSHGFECFPTPPGRPYHEEAMRFAACLTGEMEKAGHRLRGENGIRFAYYSGSAKKMVESSDTRVRRQKSFGILEKSPCPAVLVEQCFLTNYDDTKNWAGEEGYAKAAKAYYLAICDYFGTTPKT